MEEVSGEENGSATLGYAGTNASKIPGRFAVGTDLRRDRQVGGG